MIKVNNLTKSFDEVVVLQDISFEVKPNSVVILNGISGSGKSTLMGVIAGFIKPTSGDIVVNGEQIAKLPDLHISDFRAHTIGFVHQSYNLIDQLNVYENVIAPTIPYKELHEDVDVRVSKALKKAHIEHKLSQSVSTLSGGEKQRVSIARALVNDPSILLCDEPTANLDLANSQQFIEVIKELKAEGETIVIATHDPMFFGLDFVDAVINIENGMIVDG